MSSKQATAVLEWLEGLDGPRLLAVACRALERVTAEVSGDTDLGCDSALIGQGLSQAANRAVDGLGAQVLDGAVGDDALTSSVQALNRLERGVHTTRGNESAGGCVSVTERCRGTPSSGASRITARATPSTGWICFSQHPP
ncbi:MAG TPA: hypothetical protein VM287_14310, partial [Egibacteraceae bacterium]|nr:hypothetical protein [Egibacteraceae bacterium]